MEEKRSRTGPDRKHQSNSNNVLRHGTRKMGSHSPGRCPHRRGSGSKAVRERLWALDRPGGLQAALEKNRSFQGPVAALGGLQDRRVILRPDRVSDLAQASGIGRAEREEIRDD